MSVLIFCVINCTPVISMRNAILESEAMHAFWLKAFATKQHRKYRKSAQSGGGLLREPMQ